MWSMCAAWCALDVLRLKIQCVLLGRYECTTALISIFFVFSIFFTASSLGVSYLQTAACAILVQGLNISPCLDYLCCSFVAGTEPSPTPRIEVGDTQASKNKSAQIVQTFGVPLHSRVTSRL